MLEAYLKAAHYWTRSLRMYIDCKLDAAVTASNEVLNSWKVFQGSNRN